MASQANEAPSKLNRQTTPAWMQWAFGEDEITPVLNFAEDSPSREAIFDHFDVESVTELEEKAISAASRPNKRRLGVVAGADDDDPEFYSETELLELVEGLSSELAEVLVSECGDIPSLCERRRRGGEVFLGDLRTILEKDDPDKLDELEEFIDDLDSSGDNLERRMKDANVWVEPNDAVAGSV